MSRKTNRPSPMRRRPLARRDGRGAAPVARGPRRRPRRLPIKARVNRLPRPPPSPAARPGVAVAAATSRPTTRSADEAPIYIYWTGPLHVAPHADVSLPQHESIVTLEGAPVVARQQNSEIRASKLVYRSEDGSL